jgi:hypothetical protein
MRGSQTSYKFLSVPGVFRGPVPSHDLRRAKRALARRQDVRAALANLRAQETSLVVQTHLTAGKKVRDCRDSLFATPGARTYRQDEITKRKPGARLQNLSISLHVVSISAGSSSNAISDCEYLIHACCAVIHFLCTLKLTVERHFCSIFKHRGFGPADGETRYLSVSTGADFGAVNFIATK